MADRPKASFLTLPLRRPGLTLAVYWVISAIVTHVPPLIEPDPDRPPGLPLDKFAHFFGFAALAWLLMNALTARPTRGLGTCVVLTTVACLVYAVLDEITQPPFGRTADIRDFYADLLGMCLGLGLWLVGLSPRRDAKMGHA